VIFNIAADVDMLYVRYFENRISDDIDSSHLTSYDACRAHLENPVTIQSGNDLFYDFVMHVISIDVTKLTYNKTNLKCDIAHILAHWLDDSLHNHHLAKKLSRYTTRIS
jgi:hypothetical protein